MGNIFMLMSNVFFAARNGRKANCWLVVPPTTNLLFVDILFIHGRFVRKWIFNYLYGSILILGSLLDGDIGIWVGQPKFNSANHSQKTNIKRGEEYCGCASDIKSNYCMQSWAKILSNFRSNLLPTACHAVQNWPPSLSPYDLSNFHWPIRTHSSICMRSGHKWVDSFYSPTCLSE